MRRNGMILAGMILMLAALPMMAADPNLAGTVKSAAGKPLEGVGVSARASDRTFTTTVYTDAQGKYYFPPLEAGHYKMWAQAVGFDAGKAELDLAAGKSAQQSFTLAALKDFSHQLSGAEWMASLPEATAQDRRLKNLFHQQCNTCHVSAYTLENRFDAVGWRLMLDFMEKTSPLVDQRPRTNPAMDSFKEELVGYLTQVRGPSPMTLKFKPFPRPAGETAQVVVTEYDVSPAWNPGYISAHNGTDWSEGLPSRHEARAMHSLKTAADGSVWFSDTYVPGRTVAHLDPKTGKVTDYALPDKNNEASGTHGLSADRDGNIWLTNNAAGALTRFDPKTGEFKVFPRPDDIKPMGSDARVDSKGNPWALLHNPDGAVKLDVKTGKYTAYYAPTSGGDPYGIAVDAKDNIWFTQIGSDRVVVVDTETRKTSDIALAPPTGEMSDKDREVASHSVGAATATESHAFQKGPRRMAADPNGDTVWVAEYWGGMLAKFDINTKKLIKEYPVPHHESLPYAVVVDRNHMVWFSMMNEDRIGRFNPKTEQFSEFPLPSLGTGIRSIDVDNSTDPPSLWAPEFGTNKLVHLEFRSSNPQMADAK